MIINVSPHVQMVNLKASLDAKTVMPRVRLAMEETILAAYLAREELFWMIDSVRLLVHLANLMTVVFAETVMPHARHAMEEPIRTAYLAR